MIKKTNTDSGVFKAIQAAASLALDDSGNSTKEMNRIYEKRRDALINGLNGLGWNIERTRATFYVWARVPKGYTSTGFCAHLLNKAGIMVVPGIGYGKCGEGYFRASITVPEERIREAVSRMKAEKITFKG